jgi:hypothetical protein
MMVGVTSGALVSYCLNVYMGIPLFYLMKVAIEQSKIFW